MTASSTTSHPCASMRSPALLTATPRVVDTGARCRQRLAQFGLRPDPTERRGRGAPPASPPDRHRAGDRLRFVNAARSTSYVGDVSRANADQRMAECLAAIREPQRWDRGRPATIYSREPVRGREGDHRDAVGSHSDGVAPGRPSRPVRDHDPAAQAKRISSPVSPCSRRSRILPTATSWRMGMSAATGPSAAVGSLV